MRTDAASNYLVNDFIKVLLACGYKWGWVLVNALLSYKLTEWTCLAKECFSGLQLMDWSKTLEPWPNAQLHHLHYSYYISIWVLIAVQLSFSSIFHWYFSLLFYFFLHLCPSDRFDHKSIKYRLWTKVHWTFLAAHWFFYFPSSQTATV